MEISKLIADNISKHNGIFTFASSAGEDELLIDYLIEDICSYINRPILDGNSIELERGLYSDSVYCMDYDNPYIKEKYTSKITNNRVFNSALIDFVSKNNISFIIKAKTVTNSGFLGSIVTANTHLVYASSYVATVNEGMFKNQKNRYDMDGLYLNIKALIREERMEKVLN
jgi:hypothetical protein